MIKPAKRLSKKISIGLLVGGCLLFLTWLLPFTRGAWDAVDLFVFRMLNGMLGDAPKPDWFWEFSNKRIFDKVMAICYAVLAIKWATSGVRGNPRRRMIQVGMAIFCVFAMRLGVDEVMDAMDYDRLSPSYVVEGATTLKDIFPETEAKWRSKSSFPGDHALVSIWMMLYFILFSKPRYAGFAIALTLIAGMPRLVVGAHWFTDNLIGGLGFSLIFFGLFLLTGLYEKGVTIGENLCLQLEKKFGITWLEKRDPSSDHHAVPHMA